FDFQRAPPDSGDFATTAILAILPITRSRRSPDHPILSARANRLSKRQFTPKLTVRSTPYPSLFIPLHPNLAWVCPASWADAIPLSSPRPLDAANIDFYYLINGFDAASYLTFLRPSSAK